MYLQEHPSYRLTHPPTKGRTYFPIFKKNFFPNFYTLPIYKHNNIKFYTSPYAHCVNKRGDLSTPRPPEQIERLGPSPLTNTSLYGNNFWLCLNALTRNTTNSCSEHNT